MTREELLIHTDRLLEKYRAMQRRADEAEEWIGAGPGERAEVEEFLRNFAGCDSGFYQRLHELSWTSFSFGSLVSALEGFRSYVESGLYAAVSPERKAQFDVVTDLLDLSDSLLKEPDVHRGAAAMLIGATLEEYLRVWVERLGLELGNQKPGIQNYADLLRGANALGRQDVKLITAWAGHRNHAAHGEWQEVNDRRQIQIMLDGVRLFMQTHGA